MTAHVAKRVWNSSVWEKYNDWADEIVFTRWMDGPVVSAVNFNASLDITSLRLPAERLSYALLHEKAHARSQDFQDFSDAQSLLNCIGSADDETLNRLIEQALQLHVFHARVFVDYDYLLDLAEQQDKKMRLRGMIDLAKHQLRLRLRLRLAASISTPQIPVVIMPLQPNAPCDLTVN